MLFPFLTQLPLFAEKLEVDNSMPWMMPWLVTSLLIVTLFFWSIFKAWKTKNAKYGYVSAFALILLTVMLFI